MILSSIPTAFAQSTQNTYADYTIKAVYLPNLREDGSNFQTDIVDNNKYNIDTSQFLLQARDTYIEVSGNVGTNHFTISGSPVAKNSNETMIFYDGISDSKDFDVIYMSYETDVSKVPRYFVDYSNQNPEYNTIVKVYLKPTYVNTKDYLLIEIFGYELPNYTTLIENINTEDKHMYWYMAEFKPLNQTVEVEDTLARGLEHLSPMTQSVNYQVQSSISVHTIKYHYYCMAQSASLNQEAIIEGGAIIDLAQIRNQTYPSLNVDGRSELQLRDIKINIGAPANTMVWSHGIFGKPRSTLLATEVLAKAGISLAQGHVSTTAEKAFSLASSFYKTLTAKSKETPGIMESLPEKNYPPNQTQKRWDSIMDVNQCLSHVNDSYKLRVGIINYGNVTGTQTGKISFDSQVYNNRTGTVISLSKPRNTYFSYEYT